MDGDSALRFSLLSGGEGEAMRELVWYAQPSVLEVLYIYPNMDRRFRGWVRRVSQKGTSYCMDPLLLY